MSRYAYQGKVVKLAIGTYDRLLETRRELGNEKNRQVTFSEAVEYLLDYRDTRNHVNRGYVQADGVITREAGR